VAGTVAPDLDPDTLLLSKRKLILHERPFCWFYVDDYLPVQLYETLAARFPHDGPYAANEEGKLGFRSSEAAADFDAFCDADPAWAALVAFFRSDAFVRDVHRRLRAPLVSTRPVVARKPWVNDTQRPVSNDPLRYLLREPVRTTFQFSKLPRDAAVAPHTDAPRKLVSLMLYFRDPDWRDEWGGATGFYAPRDPARARGWSATQRVDFDELEPIGEAAFRANRLAGFVRSPASWHGVRPIGCPPGRGRKSLLVNLKRLKWSKRHDG